MPVVSRRPDETIVLSEVGISLRVLGIQRDSVRIAVEAPGNIRVVGGDIVPDGAPDHPPRPTTRVLSREEFHALKNGLNAVNLALRLLRRQRDAGLHDEADRTLARLLELLDVVKKEMAPHTRR